MNLVLIGYKCSGKTSVGSQLAEQVGRPFFDTDSLVEQGLGLSIREIFALRGEDYFRSYESRIIANLSKQNGVIVATGGGTFLNDQNGQMLSENGVLCYLEVTETVALDRLRADAGNKKRVEMYDMNSVRSEMMARIPTYEKWGKWKFDSVFNNPVSLAKQILVRIELDYGGVEPFFR